MNIGAITAIEAGAPLSVTESVRASASASFGSMVDQAVNQLNEKLMTSQVDLQNLALGDAQNLHEVMIRMEESRLAFQVALQVRSRVLDAYQEVMRMQI